MNKHLKRILVLAAIAAVLLLTFLASKFDMETAVRSGGILLVAAIVFAESGLLVGFFLPGDTLLVGAGILAADGTFSVGWLIAAVVVAAVLGDNVGYSIGHRAGKRILQQEDGILFRKEHIERAEEFYQKHGGKTIILARFTPIVRTFAPLVAGMGKMHRTYFMAYNIVGGILWGAGVTLLGYWFGHKIPHLDKYIHLVLIGVVVLSIGLSLLHILRDPLSRKLLKQKLAELLK